MKLKELMFDQMNDQWMTLAEIMTAAGRTKARPMPYDRQQIKALIEEGRVENARQQRGDFGYVYVYRKAVLS